MWAHSYLSSCQLHQMGGMMKAEFSWANVAEGLRQKVGIVRKV